MDSFDKNRKDIQNIFKLQLERTSTSNEILFNQPSYEKIVEWFNSHDFIDDTTTEELIRVTYAAHKGDIKTVKHFEENILPQYKKDGMRTKTTLQTAALLIINDVLVNNDLINPTIRNITEYNKQTITNDANSLEEIIEKTSKTILSIEDHTKLITASEMLLMGSSIDLPLVDEETGRYINEWSLNNRTAAIKILGQALGELPYIWDIDIEARTLYVKAMNLFFSYGITTDSYITTNFAKNNNIPISMEDLKEHRNKWLNGLIDEIETIFIGPNNLGEKKNILDEPSLQREKKGMMFESLWLLDVMMLREFEKLEIGIYASTSNEDRPIIGKPTLNHGYDATIKSLEKNSSLKFQLKSSSVNREKNGYDDSIIVLHEDNFDINRGKLINKLRTYREAIIDDFSDESYEKAKKYIMETSKDAIDKYQSLWPLGDLVIKGLQKGVKTIIKTKNRELIEVAKQSGVPILYMSRQPSREERRRKNREEIKRKSKEQSSKKEPLKRNLKKRK